MRLAEYILLVLVISLVITVSIPPVNASIIQTPDSGGLFAGLFTFFSNLFGGGEPSAPQIQTHSRLSLSPVNITPVERVDRSKLNDTTVEKVVRESSKVTNALVTRPKDKSAYAVVSEQTVSEYSTVTFPYSVYFTDTDTEIQILKYRCDGSMMACGFWIQAYRGGQEIQTNSPIWISPPPYEIVTAETYDQTTNQITVTVSEDTKIATEQVLKDYVDRQPLGTGTVGTPE